MDEPAPVPVPLLELNDRLTFPHEYTAVLFTRTFIMLKLPSNGTSVAFIVSLELGPALWYITLKGTLNVSPLPPSETPPEYDMLNVGWAATALKKRLSAFAPLAVPLADSMP